MSLEKQGREDIAPLTIEQIGQLTGLKKVNPCQLFGFDMNVASLDELPPHIQSYWVVGRALSGEPVDSWGDLGAYLHPSCSYILPKFKDFESITDGLSAEEKNKFQIILKLYLLDLEGRRIELMKGGPSPIAVFVSPNGKEDIGRQLALETIGHAYDWIVSLIESETKKSPSIETKPIVTEFGNSDESAPPEAPQPKISAFRAHLPNWLKGLIK